MWVKSRLFLWGVCLPLMVTSAVAQDVAIVPAAPAPPTLWSFLGIPQGARKVHGALFNTKGNHPKLEKKPPLKAIGDPENLKSKNDAIKQAAKVKQEEDLKPQKIKAIKYLTSIGCGCYDKDNEITKALIAASEDCTEDVRVTTMEELYKAATGKCCSQCGMSCCCKEDLLKKLAEIAYAKDETGCYVEPSERVRAGAAKVLQACCSNPVPPLLQSELAPIVDPTIDPEKPILPETPRERLEEIKPEQPGQVTSTESVRLRLSDRTPAKLVGSSGLNLKTNQPAAIVNPDIYLTSSANPEGGVVIGYDPKQQLAYVHFEDSKSVVQVGTSVYVRVDPARGKGFRGLWKVAASAAGCANLVPVEGDNAMLILPGDHVMFGEPPVAVAPVAFIRK